MSIESNLKKLVENSDKIVELLERLNYAPDAVKMEAEVVPEQEAPVAPPAPKQEVAPVETPPAPAARRFFAPTEVPPAARRFFAPTEVPPAPSAPAPTEVPAAPVITMQELNDVMVAKATSMGDQGAAIFQMLKDDYGTNSLSKIDPKEFGLIKLKIEGLGK